MIKLITNRHKYYDHPVAMANNRATEDKSIRKQMNRKPKALTHMVIYTALACSIICFLYVIHNDKNEVKQSENQHAPK